MALDEILIREFAVLARNLLAQFFILFHHAGDFGIDVDVIGQSTNTSQPAAEKLALRLRGQSPVPNQSVRLLAIKQSRESAFPKYAARGVVRGAYCELDRRFGYATAANLGQARQNGLKSGEPRFYFGILQLLIGGRPMCDHHALRCGRRLAVHRSRRLEQLPNLLRDERLTAYRY